MDNHSTASLEGKIADGEEEEEEDDAFPDLFSSGKEKRENVAGKETTFHGSFMFKQRDAPRSPSTRILGIS